MALCGAKFKRFRVGNKMKFSENTGIQRISRALAVLRQEVEEVSGIAPNFMEINSLEELPKEKRESVSNKLLGIFSYGEYYVQKLISDISNERIQSYSLKSKKKLDWHGEKYKPFIKKVERLINLSNKPSREHIELTILYLNSKKNKNNDNDNLLISQNHIDQHIDSYEYRARCGWLKNYLKICIQDDFIKYNYENNNIKGSCEMVIEAATVLRQSIADSASISTSYKKVLVSNGDCFYDLDDPHDITDSFLREVYLDIIDESLSGCEKITSKRYFKPDNWMANEKELSPIIVTEEMKKIPAHIQKRVHEIYHSFIFDNWMSAIALSRCLLEYALIHRNKKTEIKDDTGRIKPIRELASITEQAFPELKDSMDIVIEYGNYVMHPFRKTIPSKNLAKHCIEEINKIISTLYSQ